MRAVALVLSLCLFAGCFPNNARHRTIAKITEGAFLAGGITLLAVVNTGADCDDPVRPGRDPECQNEAGFYGGVGLGMILIGLVGFICTVSTTPDDDKTATTPTTTTTPTPAVTPPPSPPALLRF